MLPCLANRDDLQPQMHFCMQQRLPRRVCTFLRVIWRRGGACDSLRSHSSLAPFQSPGYYKKPRSSPLFHRSGNPTAVVEAVLPRSVVTQRSYATQSYLAPLAFALSSPASSVQIQHWSQEDDVDTSVAEKLATARHPFIDPASSIGYASNCSARGSSPK